MPSTLRIDRFHAQHPLCQLPLLTVRDIHDPALRHDARQRHRQRPGHNEIAQRGLMEDENVAAEHEYHGQIHPAYRPWPGSAIIPAVSEQDTSGVPAESERW